jgi:hypothetical protein
MKVLDVIEAANSQIIEGSPFLWKCFGKNARYLDFGQDSQDNNSASCIFDTKTKEVYEISVYTEKYIFRWTNPSYRQAFEQESQKRKIVSLQEEPTIVDMVSYQDALEKVSQVIQKGKCDETVSIPLKMSSQQFLKLSMLATEKNMTIQDLVIKNLNSLKP